MKRSITMKDVAARAGVALGTVSRIVNGNATVADHLREHVQSVIEEMGFRPNATARSMRLSRTHAVGCVVTDVTQQIAGQMLDGAENVLRDAGYAMLTASTHNDGRLEAEILAFLEERRIDGLILVLSDDFDPALGERVRRIGCPVVLWERDLAGMFGAVLTDHRDGLSQAAGHLLAGGHRDLVLIAGHRNTWVGREQVRGFEDALREGGSTVPHRVFHTDELAPDVLDALLRSPDRPSGIIANVHDIPALLIAAREAGCRLPRDLALVSIGDAPMLEVMNPSVTAVRGDGALVGRTAADMLIHLMSDICHQATCRKISVGLVVRELTAGGRQWTE